MARVTASEFAEKWARRTSAATPDYVRGVERVTESPGAKAAASADLMRARVNEAIDSGKWQRNVGAVSLQEWKRAASEKGAQRIAAGVQGASSKMNTFATQVLPFIDNVRQQVDSMPKTSLEDRIQRSVAFQRGMSQFRRS
jgi:hypothetical protein